MPFEQTRDVSKPEPGHFMIRRVKGGPLVPALIYRECPMLHPSEPGDFYPDVEEWCRPARPEFCRLAASINGKAVSLEQVWTHGRFCTPEEWRYQVTLAEWARKYAPHEPQANPFRAIDLNDMPPIFRRSKT